MLTSNVNQVLKKVLAATAQHPISVFLVKPEGKAPCFETLYGDTLAAHQRKYERKKCPRCHQNVNEPLEAWIGDFHSGHNRETVRNFLTIALEEHDG